MGSLDDHVPDVLDDPVIQLLLQGEAQTLHEAEEKYLDAAIPEPIRSAMREGIYHDLRTLARVAGRGRCRRRRLW